MGHPRSFWHVTYGGPQHGVMLRKLERLANFEAIDPGARGSGGTGGKPRTPLSWSNMQNRPGVAWRFAPTWRAILAGKDLQGEWPERAVGPNRPFEAVVSGCKAIEWRLCESQDYVRSDYSGGQANRRQA